MTPFIKLTEMFDKQTFGTSQVFVLDEEICEVSSLYSTSDIC